MHSASSDRKAAVGHHDHVLHRAETPRRRRRLSTPPPPPPPDPAHAHMPGSVELWLLSPKVPSFDHEEPWFEATELGAAELGAAEDDRAEEDAAPLPLLRALSPGEQPPPSDSWYPDSQRDGASSFAPAAVSVAPPSFAERGRRAPRSLVLAGYLAIAAAGALVLVYDDDPSALFSGLTDPPQSVAERATVAASDRDVMPTPVEIFAAADERRSGSSLMQGAAGRLLGPFNRVAAASSLARVVDDAAGCSPRPPPTDERLWVTFAPAGQVSAVRFARPALASIPRGRCVEAALRAASVPAFDGSPVTVAVRVPMLVLLQNEPAPPPPLDDADDPYAEW